MPYLNYYLDVETEITRADLREVSAHISLSKDQNDAYLYGEFDLKATRTQCKALKLALCNFVRYPSQRILYERTNKATTGTRFNPLQIGQKPLKEVMDKLADAGYIKQTIGENKYKHSSENSFALRTEVISTQGVLDLAEKLGINKDTVISNNPCLVILREKKSDGGRMLEYSDSAYTRHTQTLMTNYCAYLNKHSIKVESTGEVFSDITLRRSYRDWDHKKSLLYGGRVGNYWMSNSVSKADRATITIDDEPTVELDYNASKLNTLNFVTYGNYFPKDEDVYAIEGVDRELIKVLINRCMLNSESRQASSARFDSMCKNKDLIDLKREATLSTTEMVDAVEKRFAFLKQFFYRGEARGEHYSWWEQNILFDIAHQACLYGVPALTVHDSFIVKESDLGVMDMLMYSTAIPDLYKEVSLIQGDDVN